MAARRPPLILLPPSESKAVPARGAPLDLGRLSFPELNALRATLLDDHLRRAPTAPAGRIYTGVLYVALDVPTLPVAAARNLVVVSAQFGALRMRDRIPSYRRDMDAAYWRDGLASALDPLADGRVVVDCRSATYVAPWRPPGRVQVAVVEERDGERRVVSHMAKKTRGEIARHLLVSGARPRTAEELADAVAAAFTCELTLSDRTGTPHVLTVVQR